MVLPRLLNEAKIELNEEENARKNRISTHSSGPGNYDLLKSMGDAIDQEKKEMKRIKIKLAIFNVAMIILIIIHILVSIPGHDMSFH